MRWFTYKVDCLGADCDDSAIGTIISKDILRDAKNLNDDLVAMRKSCEECGSEDFRLLTFEVAPPK